MSTSSNKRRFYASLAGRLLALLENTTTEQDLKHFHRIVTDLSRLLEPDHELVSINTDLMCHLDFRLDGDRERADEFLSEVRDGIARLEQTAT